MELLTQAELKKFAEYNTDRIYSNVKISENGIKLNNEKYE